jgi:hypothetical protein
VTDKTSIERDFFTARTVRCEPYAWLDESRAIDRVRELDSGGIIMVTGFAAAAQKPLDGGNFAAVTSAAGPAAPLPFVPKQLLV